MTSPRSVRLQAVGGDPLGVGDRLVASWWLPQGAARQDAYRLTTDDGYDSGWVESDQVTPFHQRSAGAPDGSGYQPGWGRSGSVTRRN